MPISKNVLLAVPQVSEDETGEVDKSSSSGDDNSSGDMSDWFSEDELETDEGWIEYRKLTISPILDVSIHTHPSGSLLPPLLRPKDEAGGTDARAAVTAAVAAAKVEVASARKELAESVEGLGVAAKESKKTCRRLEKVIVGSKGWEGLEHVGSSVGEPPPVRRACPDILWTHGGTSSSVRAAACVCRSLISRMAVLKERGMRATSRPAVQPLKPRRKGETRQSEHGRLTNMHNEPS